MENKPDLMPKDPIEAEIFKGLVDAKIEFTTDPRKTQALDFFLPKENVYIEACAYHTPRKVEQSSRVNNFILVQGKRAAEFMRSILSPAERDGVDVECDKCKGSGVEADYVGDEMRPVPVDCSACDGMGGIKPVNSGWREAQKAWMCCASIHREYASGKDPIFKTRQENFVRSEQNAKRLAAQGYLQPQPRVEPVAWKIGGSFYLTEEQALGHAKRHFAYEVKPTPLYALEKQNG